MGNKFYFKIVKILHNLAMQEQNPQSNPRSYLYKETNPFYSHHNSAHTTEMMQSAKVLISLPEVERFHIDEGQAPRMERKCSLEVIYFETQDLLVLSHDNFTYGLEKNIPIFTNTRPEGFYKGKRLILPGYGFHTAFVLDAEYYHKNDIDDLDSLLDRRLIPKCELNK